MSLQQQKAPDMGRRNTRKHWALYALDAYEATKGRKVGATAARLYDFLGGDESVVFKNRADAGAALRQAYAADFAERRTIEGEWDGPELIAYRLTEAGHRALQAAGKPTKLPARKQEGYDRSLPTEPEHTIRENHDDLWQ